MVFPTRNKLFPSALLLNSLRDALGLSILARLTSAMGGFGPRLRHGGEAGPDAALQQNFGWPFGS